MSGCLFCKVVAKEIPAKVMFETDQVVAFHDINPQAPTHVLVIPKEHVASIEELNEGHQDLHHALWLAVQRVARERGIVQSGFRTVVNTGPHAGQTVFHLHVHVLGGRPLGWPPG